MSHELFFDPMTVEQLVQNFSGIFLWISVVILDLLCLRAARPYDPDCNIQRSVLTPKIFSPENKLSFLTKQFCLLVEHARLFQVGMLGPRTLSSIIESHF